MSPSRPTLTYYSARSLCVALLWLPTKEFTVLLMRKRFSMAVAVLQENWKLTFLVTCMLLICKLWSPIAPVGVVHFEAFIPLLGGTLSVTADRLSIADEIR